MAFGLAVYYSQCGLPTPHARLASSRWSDSTGRACHPQGFNERFQGAYSISSPFPTLAWRNRIDRIIGEPRCARRCRRTDARTSAAPLPSARTHSLEPTTYQINWHAKSMCVRWTTSPGVRG
jgi:hypothetical protein